MDKFVGRGTSSTPAVASISLSGRLATLIHAVQAIVGYYAITDEQCKTRLKDRMQAFNRRGITKLRDHARGHYDTTMLVPTNRGRIAELQNSIYSLYSSAMFRVGADAMLCYERNRQQSHTYYVICRL